MKAKIHPPYYSDCRVTCTCGHTFMIGSTKPSLSVQLCHQCHPFFTGAQKFVDAVGQIERFQKKQQEALKIAQTIKTKKLKKKEAEEEAPKTLREMLLAELKK